MSTKQMKKELIEAAMIGMVEWLRTERGIQLCGESSTVVKLHDKAIQVRTGELTGGRAFLTFKINEGYTGR